VPLGDGEADQAARRCGSGRAVNLPMVTGPIAIAYDPRLRLAEDLVLDAPTVAGIFTGTITSWDAPEIKALNPDLSLPAMPIRTVHRSDDSGTTENFTAYLAASAPRAWTAGKASRWPRPGPLGAQAAKGNDGVAAAVRQTRGAIGYMELSYARDARLGTARLATGAGRPVTVDPSSASLGVANARIIGSGTDVTLQIDHTTRAEGVYPLVMVTYEIVCAGGTTAGRLPLIKSFLGYAAGEQGQALLSESGYAQLPGPVAARVRAAIDALS